MATSYQFSCSDCGYEASVSGGSSTGMIAASTTILCLSCKELTDVTTRIWKEGHPMETVESFPLECKDNSPSSPTLETP